MLLIVHWKLSPQHRDKATERFTATGGPPPQGVKMIGRWHHADGSGGTVVCETNDSVALAAWMYQWTDVIEFESRPVIEDAQFGQVLQAAAAAAG
jgi:hypothetical protein